MQFIDLKSQYHRLEKEINTKIQQVLNHGSYIMGPEVADLEQKLSTFINVKNTVAVASGTDALLLALMALDIGAGDEVITSPFSFFATVETIVLLGAKPVFVDIDAKTYNMNPQLLAKAITPRTKAIMPISLYGQCADMDAINDIAKQHQLAVIEDGAQSFGARYKNRYSCSLSTVACTSFFPSKPLGAYGDGGACFSNDDALAEKIRQLRNHGQDRRYNHPLIGINGRMDSLQAAILLAKLEVFAEEIELREMIGKRYTTLLANAVKTPFIEDYNNCVYAQYTIEVADRDRIQASLQAQNIPTAVHYPVPMHLQPALKYLNLAEGNFPIAEAAAKKVLSLPMHPYLTEQDQLMVVNALKSAHP